MDKSSDWQLLSQHLITESGQNLVVAEVLSSELLSVSVLASELGSMKTMTLQVLSLVYCNQGTVRNLEVVS